MIGEVLVHCNGKELVSSHGSWTVLACIWSLLVLFGLTVVNGVHDLLAIAMHQNLTDH
jgi:hypothetical protein